MEPKIHEATIDELVEELEGRASVELTSLQEAVDRATEVLDNAKAALRARKQYFKALGFTAEEAKPRTPGGFPCAAADCDRTFDTQQGASSHFTRSHKKDRPPKSKSDVLGPQPDPNGTLQCECGDRFDSASILLAHTTKMHERRPTAAERTPR